MSLTKEQILAQRPRAVEAVDVPEWNGTVHVRKLTIAEQIAMEAEFEPLDENDITGLTAVRLAFYLCEETGAPLLTIAESLAAVRGHMEAPAVDRILKAGAILNRGLSVESVEKLKGN